MEKKPAPLVAVNFDLPAGDEFVAARADAPVIERRPFSPRIGGAQNVEAIFRGEMLLHGFTKARAPNLAIGRGAEVRILQIPMNRPNAAAEALRLAWIPVA
jgi:hypothetical protein